MTAINKEEEIYQLPKRILVDTDLNFNDIRVYCYLSSKIMSSEKAGVVISNSEIAYALNIHWRTIQRSLAKLERKNLILKVSENNERYLTM